MTDVRISPNAASIHVEGDIGGGGGDEIICGFDLSYNEETGQPNGYIRTTDEDPYFLLDAIQNGKIVKGCLHSGRPYNQDGDIQYSTAVVLSRSGSMGAFGGVEFTFVEVPRDSNNAFRVLKLKIKDNGGLAAWRGSVTAELSLIQQ